MVVSPGATLSLNDGTAATQSTLTVPSGQIFNGGIVAFKLGNSFADTILVGANGTGVAASTSPTQILIQLPTGTASLTAPLPVTYDLIVGGAGSSLSLSNFTLLNPGSIVTTNGQRSTV